MGKEKYWTDLSRVPEEALPEHLKKEGAYQPGGYHCWQCGFSTTKKGFSGRQALRAHIKSHVLLRRAWLRPLAHQGLFTLVAGALAIAGRLNLLSVPVAVRAVLDPLLMWALLVTGGAFVALAALVSFSPGESPSRGQVRILRAGRAISALALIAEAAVAVGLLVIEIAWPFRAVMWSAGALGLWLAPAAGLAGYGVKRRKSRPEGYTSLYVAVKNDAQSLLWDWLVARDRVARRARGGESRDARR
ncbi:MAG: hypothetical protein Q8O40_01435 [Chloroflexota bacterium]|nr:hypothetical protein [Chloroflexota bacterium]